VRPEERSGKAAPPQRPSLPREVPGAAHLDGFRLRFHDETDCPDGN
jgi:hypothetical protein